MLCWEAWGVRWRRLRTDSQGTLRSWQLTAPTSRTLRGGSPFPGLSPICVSWLKTYLDVCLDRLVARTLASCRRRGGGNGARLASGSKAGHAFDRENPTW